MKKSKEKCKKKHRKFRSISLNIEKTQKLKKTLKNTKKIAKKSRKDQQIKKSQNKAVYHFQGDAWLVLRFKCEEAYFNVFCDCD